MKVIKERVSRLGNTYDIYLEDNLIREVRIIRISKEYEGFHYVFLIDSKGQVIRQVYEYLNDRCKNETLSGREQQASAIKLLYAFSEVVGKRIEEFNDTDVDNLSSFILGHSIEGNTERLVLTTSRGNSTHNQYFDNMRKYLRFIDINNQAFFKTITVSKEKGSYGMLAHTKTLTIEKYKTNLTRHSNFDQYVPKYISLEEYHRIIKYMEESKSAFKLRNILIINLMYLRGLRLGEALGITIEDITPHPSNPRAGKLYLRNRVSDKKYQRAKSCLKVYSKEAYKYRQYQEKDTGYQEIVLPQDFMEQMNEYIDASRDMFLLSKKVRENILKYAKADNVKDVNEENFYLFLSKNGTPLSESGWNKELKSIFLQVGINIDKFHKRDNLSHRFRHGHAMHLIENMQYDIGMVMDKMRHRNVQTTMRYFNPKPETVLKHAEEIQNSIENRLKN